MKTLLRAITALSLLSAVPVVSLHAADAGGIQAQIEKLIPKFQAKAQSGKRAEADYAAELKELDALIAAHKNEKTNEAAELSLIKAEIYAQLFENPQKAADYLKQIQAGYPGTEAGKKAETFLAMMEKEAAAAKIQEELKPGTSFPEFTETDLDGKPLSLASYKGKIVLIDFWATWCGPCVAELPNVLKAYEKYHEKGFDIIGISLDEEKEKLTGFIKQKKMPWQQFFDGKGWQNKLATQYGINSIPATYLLDKEGRILAKGLRGEALDAALAKALGL